MEWPDNSEILFKADDDWQQNACINCYQRDSFHYSHSYRTAAEHLAELAESGDAVIDSVILPIVFLYRQFIELSLKNIINTARRLEGVGSGFTMHHDLTKLWDEAGDLIRQHYDPAIPEELSNLDPCISEFQKYDAASFAFRYPTDKKGKANLAELRHINVRNLRETMNRTANLLECFEGDLESRWQFTMDAHREMGY